MHTIRSRVAQPLHVLLILDKKWFTLTWVQAQTGCTEAPIYWDNGKENGNYYNGIYMGIIGDIYIYGIYWENGQENGNYYIIKTCVKAGILCDREGAAC